MEDIGYYKIIIAMDCRPWDINFCEATVIGLMKCFGKLVKSLFDSTYSAI